MDKIAFIIPYVNGDDPLWREAFLRSGGIYDSSWEHGWVRYKDSGVCEVLIESIRRYAPWADIYMVVAMPSQIPNYAKDKGIKFIFHSDFLPKRFGAYVFQSNAIETFIGRMNLPEKFVWLNDDIVFLRPLKPDDFFDGDVPRNNISYLQTQRLNYNSSNYQFFFPSELCIIDNGHGPTAMRYSWCREFYCKNEERLLDSIGSLVTREPSQLNQLVYLQYADLFKEHRRRELPGASIFGNESINLSGLSWLCINDTDGVDSTTAINQVRDHISNCIDILYIVGDGYSECDYNELRYSLRSIAKYGRGVGNVYVVGHCPEWLADIVVKIPFKQPYSKCFSPNPIERIAKKAANITASILYAVDNSDIGESFLVSMDDHFYIRDTDFKHYPYYVKSFGERNELPLVGTSDYRRFLAETRKILASQGLSYYYFCPHRNMHCFRSIIAECRDFLEEAVREALPVECLAYMLNYQYTKYGFHFDAIRDIKIHSVEDGEKVNPARTSIFSTVDFKKGSPLDCFVKRLYKGKSIYETTNAPFVSVIVPIYNSKPWLKRCLDSLVNQTLKNIEVILVDDGSTDGSLEIAQNYIEKGFKVIALEHGGVAKARNYGMGLACGEFIGFLDSDDWLDSRYYEYLYKHNEYDVVRCLHVSGDKKVVRPGNYGQIIEAIVRRELIEDNNIRFEERPCEDLHFKKRVFAHTNKILNCPDDGIYYYYTVRENSRSNHTQEDILKYNG